MAMRVLIVDDHAVVRRGLKEILHEEYQAAEFEEAATAQDAIDKAAKNEFSLMILDIHLPDKDGFSALESIRKSASSLPILVISMSPEEQFALHALKIGANGFLNKTSAPEDLIRAVRTLLSGGRYVSNSLSAKIEASRTGGSRKEKPHEGLSEREFRVVCGIVRGQSMKEIAAELEISSKTATTYRTRAMKKLGIKSNSELVQYAMRVGIV